RTTAGSARHQPGYLRVLCVLCGKKGARLPGLDPAGSASSTYAWAPPVLFHCFPCEVQALESDPGVDALDGDTVGPEERSEAAGGDDEHVRALPLVADKADDSINGLDGAEYDAGPHGGVGPAADDGGGRLEIDTRQPSGAAHEGF